MMVRGRVLRGVVFVLSFVGTALCKDCLEEFEAGPFGPDAKDIPLFPRALHKAPGVHAERAHHVYAQHLSLPEVVIQRSLSNWGDTGRHRALFHKLREGKPISMVVLGGSITCGRDTRRLEQQWTYQVFMWINATFPNSKHAYLNSCKPATPSSVVAACLDTHIPEEVDLILFEYTVNDSKQADKGGITDLPVMENEWRRGFERLVRKLVKLPSKPALLYFHVYQPAYMAHSFWLSSEMELETILQYYSIPTVSARNALYHLQVVQKAHGFSDAEVHCGVHPNPLGHRYYADLVIASLQDHAYAAFVVPEEHMAYPQLYTGLQAIPPPMLEQNWDFDSECLTGELLHRALVPQEPQHWEFVDEGKPGQPKLGFRTLLPDTSLEVQVDTRSSHKNFKGDVLLALGYLVSYEHMGRFSAACVSGCQCAGVHNISSTHPSTSSIYKFIYFSATQHEHCHVQVTSIHDSETGGDKVKFDMLMVATGISGTWVNAMNDIFQ